MIRMGYGGLIIFNQSSPVIRKKCVYWSFSSYATKFQLYMWRHISAGRLKKKLYLRSGSQRCRHFVGFFNVPVQAPTLEHPFYTVISRNRPYKILWECNTKRTEVRSGKKMHSPDFSDRAKESRMTNQCVILYISRVTLTPVSYMLGAKAKVRHYICFSCLTDIKTWHKESSTCINFETWPQIASFRSDQFVPVMPRVKFWSITQIAIIVTKSMSTCLLGVLLCLYANMFFFLLKQSWSRQLIIRVRSKVDTNGVIMNYKMYSLFLYILHECTSQTTNTIPLESICLGATQKAISGYFGTYKKLCLFAWILYASCHRMFRTASLQNLNLVCLLVMYR